MSVHLMREIAGLKKQIYGLSAVVEEHVRMAVRAVMRRDAVLAQSVINADDIVDQHEVTIEEECLKLLALHQPVANDLRFLVSVLKLNRDLERIGDLAVNIAKRAKFIAGQPPIELPFDVTVIAEKSQAMLHKSLDALINMDLNAARQLDTDDDEVDALNQEAFELVKDQIRLHPENLDLYLAMLNVSRHLERIADHAANLAEDVVYLIEGKIIRHQRL